MSEEDERLAVLYAARTAINGGQYISSHRIFAMLPRVLRQRWSQQYLMEVVLRDLCHEGLVHTRQPVPGVLFYGLTPKARALL